ncbi:dephospho-CoA kinase [Helicobacter bilis]|uniref:Dephospho-CoA kinase n=2 Tax=Helicobacter bilis TaxID=37372 RepID=A0A6D2CD76_9HELI|nr:dephospho-CoA kinase [Helicobacter bilis]EMZ41212.1 dephospho-CoA kinase [Helicobacter bilis WiWa]TLE06261.1 dephospho-CoA kinase [Helicobacter bilis]TLE07108.1 dephospho-CoA kinase [Helicobacter bilis]
MYYANILTGGIGCGKSTTARLLALHGFKIIDADIIARKALEAAKSSVVAAFGDEILESSDCYAMRKQISSIDSKATILTSSQNEVYLENERELDFIDSIQSATAQVAESKESKDCHINLKQSEGEISSTDLESKGKACLETQKNLDSKITYRTKPLGKVSSIESKADFLLELQDDNVLKSTTILDKDIPPLLNDQHDKKHNLESNAKAITISREKLGNIVFNNAEKKAKLESILHPLIQQYIAQECEILEKKKSPYFIDIPLYFESKYEYKKRFVICVYATRDMQIQRIQARNNLSLEDAIKRVDSQIDIEIKRSKSDFVIENTSDLKTLQKNIESFLQTFLSQY